MITLNLSNLKPKIKKKTRKRVGRGSGSGHGTYSGRGMKGQKARSGGNIKPGFEGGRMPLIRQLPKIRGFRSIHPKAQVVVLEHMAKMFDDGSVIDSKALYEKNMIENVKMPIKIVGSKPIEKKLEFRGLRLSRSAKLAVEKAGGKINDVQ